MDLKQSYDNQERDRELLLKFLLSILKIIYLREVILKKKKIAILEGQVTEFERLLNEASKAAENLDRPTTGKSLLIYFLIKYFVGDVTKSKVQQQSEL